MIAKVANVSEPDIVLFVLYQFFFLFVLNQINMDKIKCVINLSSLACPVRV